MPRCVHTPEAYDSLKYLHDDYTIILWKEHQSTCIERSTLIMIKYNNFIIINYASTAHEEYGVCPVVTAQPLQCDKH